MTSAAVTTVRPAIAVASKKQSDSPKSAKKSKKDNPLRNPPQRGGALSGYRNAAVNRTRC